MANVRENRRNILRGSFGSSLATLLSRILGLFRVILEAKVLGGGALASTWDLAFMVPNLFRRLFGEGALAQALIPLISHMETEKGIAEVRRQLAVVFVALTALLGVITVAVSGLALLLRPLATADYVRDALTLLPCLMPYAIFICLVGLMTAVVNTRGVFFLASLNALLLNIVLIAVMYCGQKYALRAPYSFLEMMAYSVLAAGALQLLSLLWLLKANGIAPLFHGAKWRNNPIFMELWKLALPGMIGGAASQVSFLVDRSLACFVGDYAVPALNYTERLVYLPIGMVAVALGSVLMANMSRAAAQQKYEEMLDDLSSGLRYVWFFCAPLAVFFIVAGEPVIRFFFMRGRFNEFNVAQTLMALQWYSVGIPAFCSTKVILPAFYARKEMKTPFYVSLSAIGVNVVFSVILMQFFRQGGIAFATVISAMANNLTLLYLLRRTGFAPEMKSVVRTVVRTVVASLLAAVPLFWYRDFFTWCQTHFSIGRIPADTVPLVIFATLFAVIYILVMLALRAAEPREIFSSLLHRRARKEGR